MAPLLRRMETEPAKKIRSLLGRFRRNRDGSTAVEFAMVGIPFFMLIFGILEIGIVFLAMQMMDNAVQDTAHLIKTGQAQTDGISKAEFKEAVCAGLPGFMSGGAGCERLYVDVQKFNTFADINNVNTTIVNGDGEINDDTGYDVGNSGEIVLVRAYYAWPMITNVIKESFADLADGSRLLMSAAAFRNEPFPEVGG